MINKKITFAEYKFNIAKIWISHEHIKLSKGFAGALVQKVIGAIGSFALAILIARYLGAEQAGVYYTAFNVVMFSSFVGQAGFDQIVMRETAAALGKNGSPQRFHQVWRKIFAIVSFVALMTSIFLYIYAPFAAEHFQQPCLTGIIRLFLLAVVAIVMCNLAAQICRGANQIWKSSYLLFASNPISCLILFGGFLLLGEYHKLAPIKVAVLSYTLAAVITCFWALKWATNVFRQVGQGCITSTPGVILKNRILLYSGFSFFIYGLSVRGINWIASLILARFHQPGEVAIFNSAVRVSTAVSFVLTAVVAVVGPRFVTLFKDGQYEKLKRVYRGAIGLTVIVATPIVLVCWKYDDSIMGIFGTGFVRGGPVLIILTVGQFVSALVGPQAQILIAFDREHTLKNVTIVGFIVGILFHLVLVPHYGAIGSAIANCTTMILMNLLTAIIVTRLWLNLKKVNE